MRYLLLFLTTLSLQAHTISNYKAINSCVQFGQKEYFAIRSFQFDSRNSLLVVDANTLKTGVVPAKDAVANNCSQEILDSRYRKLLKYILSKRHHLQNDGIVSNANGVTITTDLCPSSKSGFEERLYLALIKNFPNPVPVTLFITKRWIEKHISAFEKLRKWDREGMLNIAWGNHTALHIYHPKVPLNKNFVLSPEEHLEKDVLDLEIELLKRGALPSVFFRFPGLISDKNVIERVTRLGLITIGTNTWLAKGSKVQKNSIILVHGNKNEPKGVDIFLEELHKGAISTPVSILQLIPMR
ncbi:MAG TPA: hypothetical protein ENL00_04585 [Nitratifractor sp.]|nr:hypothetical protein [Nitratifractor sp.]